MSFLSSDKNTTQKTEVEQSDLDFNNVDTGYTEGADYSTSINFNLNGSMLGSSKNKTSISKLSGSKVSVDDSGLGNSRGGAFGDSGGTSAPGTSAPAAPIIAVESTDHGSVKAGLTLGMSALDVVENNAQAAFGSIASSMEANAGMFDKALESARSEDSRNLSELVKYGAIAFIVIGGLALFVRRGKS